MNLDIDKKLAKYYFGESPIFGTVLAPLLTNICIQDRTTPATSIKST
jgi:hypothetical protein